MNILAVDFGTRRIGVALGANGSTAWAKALRIKNLTEAHSLLDQLIREEKIEVILFGLPLRLGGAEKEEAKQVRDFAGTVSRTTGRPAVFIDERLTSEEATLMLREQGITEKEMKHHVDATVARLLLEQYYREQRKDV